jgi:dolichol-phosphate mannosyltransferase
MPSVKNKISLGIYIPLFNEEDGVKQLHLALNKLIHELFNKCVVEIVLIDDGSKDKTLQLLNKYFSQAPFKIIEHKQNKNLGGFLKTAINDCNHDYIAFLDSDCTYNPLIIDSMFEKSLEGYDIVNASPYHPDGQVVGLGKIRLFLSRSVNKVYRIISRKNFYTTSSICKIYKTEVIKNITITRKNFVAVTELFTKAVLSANSIIDYPCSLSARIYGVSKLNIYSNIYDHINYIFYYLIYKNGK